MHQLFINFFFCTITVFITEIYENVYICKLFDIRYKYSVSNFMHTFEDIRTDISIHWLANTKKYCI